MKAATLTAAIALAWAAGAWAQDAPAALAKVVPRTQLEPVATPDPSAGLFPVPPPAIPDLERLAGTPGTPMGDRNLSRFEEPQLNQVKSNIMARYEVRADRIPQFRLRDVYTRAGLEDYSMRVHPGLLVGNFFDSNRGQAYEMYLEDERLGNVADLVDTALAITVGGDRAEGDAILHEVRTAYSRDERTDPLQSWEDVPKTRTGEPIILNLELLQVNWLTVKF